MGFPFTSFTYSILKPPSNFSSKYFLENPAALIAGSIFAFSTNGVLEVLAALF